MRILLIYATPLSNVFLRAFVQAYLDAGHAVGVCTSPCARATTVDRLPPDTEIFEVGLPRGANMLAHLRALRGIRRAVRTFKPDVVHAHMSAAVFAVALARRWSVATIGTFHGLAHPSKRGVLRLALWAAERWAIGRLDEVQVVNGSDFEAVRRLRPLARVLLLRAGFGCDIEKYNPRRFSAQTRVEVRRELGLSEGSVVGAYIGRMVKFKGLPSLIHAFRDISASEPLAKLLVIGRRDPLHASGLTPDDEAWIARTDAVRHVGFTDMPERYLSACDYLVMPSLREGLSTVIMEALCMSLPVITTTARGCGELIEAGTTGMVVAPGDVPALTEALLGITRDGQTRRRWGGAAHRLRGQLDRKACVREALSAYQNLLAASR